MRGGDARIGVINYTLVMGPEPSHVMATLLTGLAALAAGAVFFWRGLRGSRRGPTPHCRECDYPLVGIASDRCPECGADLRAPGGVAIGERVRRKGLAALGIVLGLVGVVVLVVGGSPAVRNFDYYRLMPAGWLVDRVASPAPPVANRAWSELKRRMQSADLPANQRGRLAELALKQQAAGTRSELLDWLAQAILDGKINDAQKERFFQQAVTLSMVVRPQVVLGDPIPCQIRQQGSGPVASEGWWYEIQEGEVLLGDKVGSPGGGSSSGSGFGDGGSTTRWIPCDRPGRQTLTTKMSVKLYHGGEGLDPASLDTKLLHQRDVTLTASAEVVPAERGPAVAVNEDPALEPVLRAGITPKDLQWHAPSKGLDGAIEVRPVTPAALAFEVFVRAGGQERRVGTVTRSAMGGFSTTHFTQHDMDLDLGTAGRVDVILRSSEEVARKTVDLYGIWKGELVYRDVPVKTLPPPK